MPDPNKPVSLFRYTTLPVLLDILQQRHIILLSPKSWVDQNDAFYLQQYQLEKKLRSLLAVCLTERGERYQYWHVFCHGSSGVCIEFDKDLLLKSFPDEEGFRHQVVDYKYLQNNKNPELSLWPFLKRYAFKDEKEYRIIFEDTTQELNEKVVPIDIASVRSIILSPWLPKSIAASIQQTIRVINGCSDIKLPISTMLENKKWRNAIKRAKS